MANVFSAPADSEPYMVRNFKPLNFCDSIIDFVILPIEVQHTVGKLAKNNIAGYDNRITTLAAVYSRCELTTGRCYTTDEWVVLGSARKWTTQ